MDLHPEYTALPESALLGSHQQKPLGRRLAYSVPWVALGSILVLVGLAGWQEGGSESASSVSLVAEPFTPPQFAMEPHGKHVVRQMDAIIAAHFAAYDWKKWGALMLLSYRERYTYDCVPFGVFSDVHKEYLGVHIPYNQAFSPVAFTQMIFLGDEHTASTTTYAKALFVGPLMGVKPTRQVVTFRIVDFYEIPDKITYNLMMLDIVDIFRQVGVPVLPPAALPEEGFVQPPASMDGVPAPISAFADPKQAAVTRDLALKALKDDWERQVPGGSDAWSADMIWYGPAGFGVARGLQAYRIGLLSPMSAAMSNPSVETRIISCEGDICGVYGIVKFRQKGALLGQLTDSTSAKVLELRFAFHYRSVGHKLVEGYALFDLPGLFSQWGIDLYERARSQQSRE